MENFVSETLIRRRPRRRRRVKERGYHKRTFLNERDGMAAIEASVRGNASSIDANICITDCHRQINLDFDGYDVEGIERALKKIRRLLAIVAEVEQQMVLRTKDAAADD